jgi:hypothetical protein
MARQLNEEQQMFEKTNALHNDMVNTYRTLADQIRTFDGYLMAILVMQYHLAYAREALEDLPETDMPKLTKSIADKIEDVALDAVGVKMAYNGLKAIGRRIANIVQESGIYKKWRSGESDEPMEAEMEPELDSISTQSSLLRSGNVELLTGTDMDAKELGDMADELKESTEDLTEVSEVQEEGEEGGEELSEMADSVTGGTEAAAEASEAAAEAGEAAAEAGVEVGAEAGAVGAASILGPAAVILIVAMEIISTIEASETHKKLKKAEAQMKKLQQQSDKSLATLRKAFKSLLTSAKLDIVTYNKVLTRLYQLEKNETYKTSFTTTALETFINGLDQITIDQSGGLPGYQAACSTELQKATDYIRTHAQHDAVMTEVVSKIKTHLRQTGQTTVDDKFLADMADVEDIDVERIKTYNVFRQYIAEFAAVLRPYHEQIRQSTPPDAKTPVLPQNPNFGKPDPSFEPNPNDFTVPSLSNS